MKAGREVTNIEMGRLTAAVLADALGVGEQQPTEAAEDPLWDGVFCICSPNPTGIGYGKERLNRAG